MSETVNRTWADLKPLLDANIPRNAISTRQGGAGARLSYLTGHYVIARLNEVIGQGAWSYETLSLQKVFEGTYKNNQGKDIFSVSYVSTVKLIIGGTQFTDVGFGDGTDAKDPGKAHELATKEAVTDALKRCAKNLGWSLGLALYDKEQTHVTDEEDASGAVRAVPARPAVTANNVPAPVKADVPAQGFVKAVLEANPSKEREETQAPVVQETQDTLKLIRATARTLTSMKKMTMDEMRHMMDEKYGVTKTDELNPTQQVQFLRELDSRLSG